MSYEKREPTLEEFETYLQRMLPKSTVRAVGDRDTAIEKSGEGACDFCYASPAPHIFACETSIVDSPLKGDAILGRAQAFVGDWGACDVCARLIGIQDRNALENRAVGQMRKRYGADDHIVRSAVRTAHRAFWRNRIPTPSQRKGS